MFWLFGNKVLISNPLSGEGAAVAAQRPPERNRSLQGGGDGAHGQEDRGQQGRHSQGDGIPLLPEYSGSQCTEMTTSSYHSAVWRVFFVWFFEECACVFIRRKWTWIRSASRRNQPAPFSRSLSEISTTTRSCRRTPSTSWNSRWRSRSVGEQIANLQMHCRRLKMRDLSVL